jgi:nicotinamide mononucleotide transporter
VSDSWLSVLPDAIQASVTATDSLTWTGTVLAVLYVLLALRLSRWCWVAGTGSSVLFVVIYFNNALYYESLLNVLYAALGVYGWIQWGKGKAEEAKEVTRSSGRYLLNGSMIALAVGMITGTITHYFLRADLAYADATLSTFSIFATVLAAGKKIENWIFWIVIDAVSAFVYILKGPTMYLVAVLFIFYTCMAIAGYFSWKKKLQ